MDVRLLLNAEDPAPRPRICRFGPFERVDKDNHPNHKAEQLQRQQHHHQPHPRLPSLQSRTPSYSSVSSTSTASSSSYSPSFAQQAPSHRCPPPRNSCSGSLPPISTRVPDLVRSDSGDSDRAQSPVTPDTTPRSTPSLRQDDALYAPADKAGLYIGRALPRPQLLSHASSSSGAPSIGPPSSMDSFATTTPGSGFMGDMTFPHTPIQPQLQPYYSSQMPIAAATAASSPEQQQQNAYSSSTAPAQKSSSSQKKNSYPCPLARQFNCSEFFTTSGHAARHAKKHTGKKDAICPECNKAFTRKDNMEQHRRTHSKDSSSARSNSKSQSDKDDSRQRKVLKMQQSSKKHRPPPLSTSTSAPPTSPLSNHQIATMASPSIPSTITSPAVEMSTPVTSHSAPTPLTMDLALDPRLRDGSTSSASASASASGPASAFSPPGFGPSSFSMSNASNAGFPPQFSPTYSSNVPQQQFQLPQQQQQPLQHHHRHSSMSMNSAPPAMVPMDPMLSQSPQRASVPQPPFGNSLDFMSSAQLGLGMSMPTSSGLDMGMPGGMNMMMEGNNLPMSMSSPIAVMGPGGDLQSPGLSVTPAMDKLALDKLALAAEAASNGQ